MAYEIPGAYVITLPAHESLTAVQYRFVTFNSDGEAAIMTSETAEYPIGILQNAPAAGGAANIMLRGVSKYVCDAVVTCAALVGPGATGICESKTVPLAVGINGQWICGQALDTTAAAGDVGTVLLRRPFQVMIEA
jgi:hypothetical protein